MSTIDAMILDFESITKNADIVKVIILDRLLKDKIISKKDYDEYSTNWNVICIKDSWFKKWKNKFFKDEKDGYRYHFVKFEE